MVSNETLSMLPTQLFLKECIPLTKLLETPHRRPRPRDTLRYLSED